MKDITNKKKKKIVYRKLRSLKDGRWALGFERWKPNCENEKYN